MKLKKLLDGLEHKAQAKFVHEVPWCIVQFPN